MQPGFNVGHGVISVSASIDKDQIARAVGDAGKRAGQGLIKSIAENLKRDKGATVAAGSAGEEAGSGFSRGFGNKAKSFGKTISKGFGSTFSKALIPVLGAAGTSAVAVAGPAIGAALGVAITAGISLAGIGAGIALVADRPEVKEAASKFKESLFGMSKEDRDKLDANIEATKKKIEGMQKRLSRTDAKSDTAKYLRQDIAEAQTELEGFQQKQKTSMNGLLRDAAKPFIKPTVDAINQFSAMMQRLGPSFNRIFASLAPHVTTLTQGIIGGIEGFMPGLEKMLLNSGPMIAGIANSITAMGKGTGQFLNFMTTAVGNFRKLWGGDGGTGPFSNLPGIVTHIKGLGGTFREVFSGIFKAINDNKTQFQTLINFIMGISKILWSAVGPIFKALGVAIKAVIGILGGLIDFFAGVFTGDWKRAGDGIKKIWFSLWEGIKGILNNAAAALKNITFGIWNGIKGSVTGFKNWFVNGWRTMWTNAKNDVTNIGTSIKNAVTNLVDSIKTKFNAFKNNTIAAFTAAKDGVAKVWNKLKDVAKAPVNFVIDPVYANIKNLWNNIASKVGLKELPNIAKFAKGGIAPGVGSRDTVPAMLTPGEGILTKKEMKKIGGPKGFAAFRNQLQYFNDGGIVGWVKDKLGGAVRGGLYSGAKSVADRWVYPFINQMQGGDGFEGLMKAGANTLINKALSWIKGDDKKNALHFGNYPSSPSAQRGDSGVWRSVVKLIKSGPKSGSFGNAYRPGDPLWHGSGRAVDWMGYNQDALASFLASKRPLELIHRTNRRDYAYTRGQNMGSFDNPLMEEHRNHIHVAMDKGGVIPPKSTAMVTNATSDKEFAMTVEHLKGVVGATNIYATLNVNMEDLDSVAKLIDVIEQLPRALQAGVQTAY